MIPNFYLPSLSFNNRSIAIGGNVLDTRYYTGLMDDVKIFDAVLLEDEIKEVAIPLAINTKNKLTTTWGQLKEGR